MIKGCQKRIIHITNTGSPYFDEAYFILKRACDAPDDVSGDDNMVKEAVKIATETLSGARSRAGRKRRRRVSAFMYGASVCSLLFGFAMLLILAFSHLA